MEGVSRAFCCKNVMDGLLILGGQERGVSVEGIAPGVGRLWGVAPDILSWQPGSCSAPLQQKQTVVYPPHSSALIGGFDMKRL